MLWYRDCWFVKYLGLTRSRIFSDRMRTAHLDCGYRPSRRTGTAIKTTSTLSKWCSFASHRSVSFQPHNYIMPQHGAKLFSTPASDVARISVRRSSSLHSLPFLSPDPAGADKCHALRVTSFDWLSAMGISTAKQPP